MTQALLLLHFAATWYLVGLCWLIQRVQYPLMDQVGRANYAAYEQAHVSRIGPVVAPVMLIELATGLWLVFEGDPMFRSTSFLVAMGVLIAIWVSTFLVQVPLHDRLVGGFDVAAHASLVSTNWIRTIGWTIRGALLFWMLWANWLRQAT